MHHTRTFKLINAPSYNFLILCSAFGKNKHARKLILPNAPPKNDNFYDGASSNVTSLCIDRIHQLAILSIHYPMHFNKN